MKISLTDTVFDVIYKVSERVPGAVEVCAQIMKTDRINGMVALLDADDMNLRGANLWEAYKICNNDIRILMARLKKRDPELVKEVNANYPDSRHGPAVERGASFEEKPT